MTTCADVPSNLFAWQLGACESLERDRIDAHLMSCAACLARALSMKRVTEDAAAFDERPSLAVRTRVRGLVARKTRSPVRLVIGLAVAALFLAFVGWRLLTPPSLMTPPSVAGHGLVDADGPANLDVF